MTRNTRILYIEDDVGSQRLVRRVLENYQFTVAIAEEGLMGINLAEELRPDLILMDINLPGMNGREVTTRIRGLQSLRQTPIVALTANTGPGHRERALAAGCDGFLTKPIDVVRFPQEVEAFLDGFREQLDHEEQLAHLQDHAQDIVARLEQKIRELEKANEDLRELDQMKSNFIALVSHELRTPLTLLEGYAHLLEEQIDRRDGHKYTPEMSHLMRGMAGGIGRLSTVINEVINVSRIVSGTFQLSVGPLRLDPVIEGVIEDYRDAIERRLLRIDVEMSDDLPVIQGDGRQLKVAIGNVVGNAIKYTPDGGSIRIATAKMNDAIDIIVSDSGIGIPLEEQPRIFDQFYALEKLEYHSTSKVAFRGGGLGVGLAITKGIVEAHQGRVWVNSPGQDPDRLPGSTFHLLLPVAPGDTAPPPGGMQSDRAASNPPSRENR